MPTITSAFNTRHSIIRPNPTKHERKCRRRERENYNSHYSHMITVHLETES